ncbi:hypothetical protein F5Y14DRAFT_455473 [Nemania sp. NC0429]|nr:hypothetical protein F5Y14DRAFT_455473 [Nemania sp. NC0429]
MTSLMRILRPVGATTAATRRGRRLSTALTCLRNDPSSAATTSPFRQSIASLHVTSSRRNRDGPPPTDFAAMDVLGNTPVPSTIVDICMSDGFQLNSGARIVEGSGVILVGGEAFEWRPWLPRGEHRLLNAKGQWEIPNETLGLLSLLWPRPDLLILGLGPEIRPISPELRRYISSLGMRVEILDTRNAASQFNLLATERGIDDVAAALIPIGWKEGIGANW